MIITALMVVVAMSLFYHLGLLDEISRIASKILSCPKCMAFWSCLAIFLYSGENAVTAITLSVISAYASLWMSMPLELLNELYEYVWKRKIQKRKSQKRAKT